MIVHRLTAFTDNYIFAIEKNNSLMIVDPGEAAPVLKFLNSSKLKLETILLTHCHQDHIGGVVELLETTKNLVQIIGPERLKEKAITPDLVVREGSIFQFQGIEWQSLHLPGHTLDHMAYFNAQEKIFFCGDILFSLGCGRLFEGSFEQAFESLQRFKRLPLETRIYFAHEYTLLNCDFHIQEFETSEYRQLRQEILKLRQANQPTVPSTLAFELKFNSFLKAPDLSAFTQLRKHRNDFSGVQIK